MNSSRLANAGVRRIERYTGLSRQRSSSSPACDTTGAAKPGPRSPRALHRVAAGEGASERLRTAFAAIACVLLLAGCARPTGDFGRARPDLLHDTVMPAAGQLRLRMAGDPVSSLQLTAAETRMRNRIERFVLSPHADWYHDAAVELRRTRISAGRDRTPYDPGRYYDQMISTGYATPETRYNTVSADIAADMLALPATFADICEVRTADRRRSEGLAGIDGITPRERADVEARRAENEQVIGWFVTALSDRYTAYNHALDRLIVAAPDPAAKGVNEQLVALFADLRRAQSGAFCAGTSASITVKGEPEIPSRFAPRP